MDPPHFLDIEEPDFEMSYQPTMEEKLFALPVDKKVLQEMVAEYFGENAHYRAWCAFKQETQECFRPWPLLEEREAIREMVERGDLLNVVDKVASVSSFIFCDYPELLFLVVRQSVLEDMCLRGGSEAQALLRVEKELAPLVESAPGLLEKLEELVAEIVFGTQTRATVAAGRKHVFDSLNRKILYLLDYEIQDTLKILFTQVKDLSAKNKWIKEIKIEME